LTPFLSCALLPPAHLEHRWQPSTRKVSGARTVYRYLLSSTFAECRERKTKVAATLTPQTLLAPETLEWWMPLGEGLYEDYDTVGMTLPWSNGP